jgi:hypothetical protein
MMRFYGQTLVTIGRPECKTLHSLHYLVSAPAGMIMFYAKPKVLEERISADKLAKLGAGLIQPLRV